MVVIVFDPKAKSNQVSSADQKNAAAERPKRPLSAYNLFYRFKRDKILEAFKNGGEDSKEVIDHLIMAVPGLEDVPSSIVTNMTPEQVQELRRSEIRSALQESLTPKDTRNRRHRKSHGALNFLEMNKVVVAGWRLVDEFARSVFEELANEGRRMYHQRVAEYEAKYPNSAPISPKKKNKLSTSSTAVATPKKTQVKPLVLKKPPTIPFTDVFSLSPKATKQILAPCMAVVTPPVTSKPSMSMPAATFGYVEDHDMDLDLDPMPFFSDISDVFENDVPSSSTDEIISTHLVSPGASETSSSFTSPSPSEENEFDDFFLPQQPFIMEENKPKASDASADDFMDLIARLM